MANTDTALYDSAAGPGSQTSTLDQQVLQTDGNGNYYQQGSSTPYTGGLYSGSLSLASPTSGSAGVVYTQTGQAGSGTAQPAAAAPAPTPATPVAPTANQAASVNAAGVQGTTLTPDQMASITAQNAQNATNPTLPAAATATPVNQQVQSGEMLSNQTIDPNADQVNTADGNVAASTVQNQATAANPTTGMQAVNYSAAQLDPTALANTTQAVTAALPADALVSTQLQELLTPDANGNLPAWVQPAVTAANQFLAGRGISNSTMAGQAITAAILTAAIPIATSNASAVLTAFTQNLSDEQQAALQNGQAVVQGMLSNQAAQNAAANFNATSDNQTNQYLGSLAAQINQFNASQTNAISQFNASQTQTAATASAQLQAQLDQFNANLANQREQFNVQNAIIVQQSNAEYLRAVNTANTAVANQDNQLNATNAMAVSNQAMANLQQQFNDEATMLYNSGMTQEQQNYSLAYLSQQYGLQNQLDQNITSSQENQALNQQIGNFAGSLFNGTAITGAANAISGLFGDSSSSSGDAGVTLTD